MPFKNSDKIMVCMPSRDPSAYRGPDYSLRPADCCGEEVIISPSTVEILSEDSDFKLCCLPCMAKELRDVQARGGGIVPSVHPKQIPDIEKTLEAFSKIGSN